MSTLQERFAQAIAHFEKTKGKRFVKAHLADFCNVSRPAVTDWIENNTQTLEQSNAEKAAQFLGVNHRWLNGLNSQMLDDAESQEKISSQYRPVMAWEAPDDLDPDAYMIIPHVDIKFSAGNGRLVEFEAKPKMTGCAHPLEWFHKKKLSPKNLVEIDVIGDSMEPKIPNGSVVTIDTSIKSLDQIQNRKVYAIRYGDELKIKRLSRRYDGALIIDSDNPGYEREIVEIHDLEHIGIIGKYVSHAYDGEI